MGTGIGGGIVERGRIVEGRHSHGGECGHIIIQMENGRQCGCGGYGHLEAYASATSLVKRAIESLEQSDEPTVLRTHLAAGTLTARAINDASLAGDPLSARLMRETAHYLAVGAVCLMHTINPDIVLFGGGMSNAGPEFIELIRQGVKRLAFPMPASKTRIDYATLGGDAGYIGAAGCARMAFGGGGGG
jgi:glucokinase